MRAGWDNCTGQCHWKTFDHRPACLPLWCCSLWRQCIHRIHQRMSRTAPNWQCSWRTVRTFVGTLARTRRPHQPSQRTSSRAFSSYGRGRATTWPECARSASRGCRWGWYRCRRPADRRSLWRWASPGYPCLGTTWSGELPNRRLCKHKE